MSLYLAVFLISLYIDMTYWDCKTPRLSFNAWILKNSSKASQSFIPSFSGIFPLKSAVEIWERINISTSLKGELSNVKSPLHLR